MLFQVGKVVSTPIAFIHLLNHDMHPLDFVRRHVAGDYGDICDDDILANTHALHNGLRILSSYLIGREKVYVITEADRSVTTVLLASEY